MDIRKKSQRQEKKVAKDLKGKVTIASGALYFQKGDVRNDAYLVEAKTTSKSFYSLKKSIWEKVKKEAIKDSLRIPLMHIELNDGKQEFVIISYDDFRGLDLDKYNYYGLGEPYITEKSSFRIKEDILSCFDLPLEYKYNKDIFIPRADIKFSEGNIHLVVLDWSDFLLIKEVD